MKKVKVVLHVMADESGSYSPYKTNGSIHLELEEKAGVKIDFVSFCGMYLDGEVLERFLTECEDAQVVIVDAWNHPLNKHYDSPGWLDPEESIAKIAEQVIRINPLVKIFADLMEGRHEVAVHKVAEPIRYWADNNVIEAVKRSIHKEGRS